MGHRHKDHRKPKDTPTGGYTPKTPVAHEKQIVVTSPKPEPKKPIMVVEDALLPPRSWLEEVYQSVFEPGVNKAMEYFIHLTFACLFASLAFLQYLVSARDIHVWLLTMFAMACYGSLCWFIREMRLVEAKEAANKNK